ncbi:Chaperone protein ClpC3, chloroplastic, partial [Frankliniella fusca]
NFVVNFNAENTSVETGLFWIILNRRSLDFCWALLRFKNGLNFNISHWCQSQIFVSPCHIVHKTSLESTNARRVDHEVTPFTRNLERGKVSPRRPLLTIVMTAPESITASQLTPLMVHFTMGLPGVGKSCGLREVSAAVLTTLDAATSSFPVSASTTTTTTTSETTAASSATPTVIISRRLFCGS